MYTVPMHSSVLDDENPAFSPHDRTLILDTLDEVVGSPLFRKSRRYPALLKYSVQHTIDAEYDLLKERIIGSEVFGRAADYDTNEDPVVRITAGEVRKRLQQYFVEHRDAPVRIDLPSGRYVAEFHMKGAESPSLVLEPSSDEAEFRIFEIPPLFQPIAESSPLAAGGQRRGPLMRIALLCAVCVCVTCVLALWSHWRSERKMDFWRPVLLGTQQPLIVVGLRTSSADGEEKVGGQRNPSPSGLRYRAVMANTVAAADICGVLARSAKSCQLVPAPTTSFTDIRSKPLMLIGSFDNPWTERLMAPLRFHFYPENAASAAESQLRYVVDANVSANHSPWAVDASVPSTQRTRDYSVIARFHSDITESPVVAVAGIGTYGTRSAAEYVISPARMAEVLTMAPKQWAGFNFEAVLQTDIVEGHAGHTTVVATYFW